MYFALQPGQRQLQESVRAFARAHSSEAQVRAAMAAPAGPGESKSWLLLAEELGVVTLASGDLPDGQGGTLVDAACVLEVLGECLFCGPYLSSVRGTQILCALAPQDPARLLTGAVATGRAILCVVRPQEGDRLGVSAVAGESVLDGRIAIALDGALADILLVQASDGSWHEVAGNAPGLERTALPSLDQTRRLAELTFAGVPGRPLELAVPPAELSARLDVVEQIAVAADQVGVARHSLQAAVDRARERSQFGRQIGAFQAVQQPLADIALAVECAWAATFEAAWTFDNRPAEAARAAALAAACAGTAALDAAELTMQVCAGVGFTWDHPAHLYLKRAKSNRLLWGDPDTHRRTLADLLSL